METTAQVMNRDWVIKKHTPGVTCREEMRKRRKGRFSGSTEANVPKG